MPCCGPTNWINLSLNSSTTISGIFIKHFIYLVELQAPGFPQNPIPFRKHSQFLLIDVLEDPTEDIMEKSLQPYSVETQTIYRISLSAAFHQF